MSTTFTDGSLTVTLDEGLNRWLRGLLSDAERGTLEAMEAEAGSVADEATRVWYQQVERRTGLSGRIETATNIDRTRGLIRVSVGSTDPRRDKKGKQAVLFVHRPRATSQVRVQVTNEEYWAAPKSDQANYAPSLEDKRKGLTGPFVWRPNPARADGKYLVPELIRKPTMKRVQKLALAISEQIAARVAARK